MPRAGSVIPHKPRQYHTVQVHSGCSDRIEMVLSADDICCTGLEKDIHYIIDVFDIFWDLALIS